MIRTMIGIRRALPGLLIVTAAFIPVRTEALELFTAPRNAEVDARGARSVRIEAAAGGLRVEGQSGLTKVRVRGSARSSRRGRLANIKLIAERRGDVVFIKANMPVTTIGFWNLMNGDNGRMELDLVIEVPTSIALDVSDGSGDAEFINTGPLVLHDGSGEINIRGSHGDVRVSDGSGNLVISGVEGNVVVDDGSGEIRASNVTGDFTVESDGSGNMDVSGVGGTMRVVSDGSGNIDVDRVGGDFVVDNGGSGTIRYDVVKGTVRVPERRRRG
ncbi:MAG: hypothetical protein Q7S20_11500 [Gemmatimonadaceae bacterium]|nr:hypothetical protein [Gemmatimonadaceae bacterium]